MNREILFRAKSSQSWCYGYVHKDYESPMPNKWRLTTAYGDVKVINSDTIGEWTGLLDKNNVMIFEGDIITFEDVCCEGGSGYEYPDEWAVEAMNRVEVIIHNGCVCFGKELFESNAYEDIQFYYPNLNEWFTECTEVIGNIYDNPELVKA